MIYPIVRMYATAQQAAVAVDKLRTWGFPADAISVVGPAAASDTPQTIDKALMAAYVPGAETDPYIKGVLDGHSVVVVRAPFGLGGIATEYLISAGPVDSGLNSFEPLPAWDDAAPLSSALHIPVLTGRSASPYSTPCLLTRNGGTVGAALGLPELTDAGTPTTEGFGMPMLSDNPAPLSSLLHLPVLLR